MSRVFPPDLVYLCTFKARKCKATLVRRPRGPTGLTGATLCAEQGLKVTRAMPARQHRLARRPHRSRHHGLGRPRTHSRRNLALLNRASRCVRAVKVTAAILARSVRVVPG